uniref:RdRp n=1 Tax=viral metagenome TaxID=1070528 RepID=A0A2V0R9E5_9ZZZZ
MPNPRENQVVSTSALQKQLNISSDVARRLAQTLDRVKEGNSDVLRTPLFKDMPAEDALSVMDEFMDRQRTQTPLDAELDSLENSQKDKFGPRSIAKPWDERRESIEAYFSPYTGQEITGPGFAHLNRLRPISIEKAVGYLKNSTSSGLPYYIKKALVKKRLLRDNGMRELLRRKDPCILFTRTQEQGKTRGVWGYPIADTTLEMRYFVPLLELQKKKLWRAALVGPEAVDQQVTELFKRSETDKFQLVSIDFSAYDASIKRPLQALGFGYVKDLFQTSCSTEIDYIQERFATIPLVTPDGIMTGDHGVPSGSTFTNEIDSLVQFILFEKSGVAGDKLIQGDDGLYAVNEPDTLMDYFERHGLKVNTDKSHTSSQFCTFLQNYYSRTYTDGTKLVGVYPLYRAFNRLLHTERWVDFEEYELDGSDYWSIRAISILENCKNHPYFKEFVKLIAEADRTGLTYSGRGLYNYANMIKQSKGAGELIRNQYGDDVNGLERFETVKILNEINSKG